MDCPSNVRISISVIAFFLILSPVSPGQEKMPEFNEHSLAIKTQPLKPPKPGEKLTTKLAPEIALVKLTGGTLVGVGEKSTAVIRFANADSLDAALKSMTANQPQMKAVQARESRDRLFSLKRIIISYEYRGADKTRNEPLTAEELKELGLVLERTRKSTGSSIVKVPAGLTKEAVTALENNPRVVFVEPEYIVSLPTPQGEPDLKKQQEDNKDVNPNSATPPERDHDIHEDEHLRSGLPSSGFRFSPTGVSSLAFFPNDPQFGQQWGLMNIHAPDAWDSVTATTRIVAVIDTGVDRTHPQLQANLWVNAIERAGMTGVDDDSNGFVDDIHGYDFARNDGDPDDETLATAPFPLGHGTHVSGTIGAVGNDNLGVSGVFWQGQVMSLKFMTPRHATLPDGTIIATSSGSNSDAIDCLDYAVQNGATVVNASYGRFGSFSTDEFNSIVAARDQGVIFVAAAGNDSTDNDAMPHYPSSYGLENIVAVAAIDAFDQLAGFSNFGQVSVDLAAPGRTILSTVPGWSANFPTANASGTSMATPHVAGATALIWNHPEHAGRSWKEIIGLVLANARSLASLSDRCVTGATLDLAFLAPPIPDAGEAYRALPEQIVRAPRNLGTLDIQLDDEMYVHIRAESTAQLMYPSRGKNVSVGISRSAASGTSNPESLRRFRLKNRGDIDELQSSLGLKLPAGYHRFYFQIAPDDRRGISIKMGRGNIMIEAFGKKLGGDL